MKILVFDKFLGYHVGGAQNSLHFLLKNIDSNFEFLGCEVKKKFLADKYKLHDFQVGRIPILEVPFFPYLEYWINKNRIKKIILNKKADLLITQGLWGGIAVNCFNGKSIYFIRDEYHFNKIPIHQTGIIKIFKKIYILLQYPFVRRILKDNKNAIKKADLVVANSQFMSDRLKYIFGINTDFIYPLIDIEELKKKELPKANREFITSIGSEHLKGVEIVKMIAQNMPDHKFMIVGRNIRESFWENNILYHPWEKDVVEIYKNTRILLGPSLGQEAFYRGGAEAMALGIPCVGSKIGGIPEVLGEDFLIDDIWNIEKWKNKILDIERNYEKYCIGLREKSLKFDANLQIGKFKKIVKEELGLDL